MATVADWNFFNKNVQSGLLEGRYLNAAFTLIAAGSPRLAATSTPTTGDVVLGRNIAYPMGVLQSFNISQNSQVLRLWEIGSERSYFMRGRVVGQVALGHVMYHGPSLLRKLYAYLKSESGPNQFESLYENNDNEQLNTSSGGKDRLGYAESPGYQNLWLNLASDVFSQPIGLLLYFRDSNEAVVGAIYLEYCMVTNHGLGMDSNGTIITENAAILYERLVPVDVQGVALIKDSEDVGDIVSSVVGSAA